MSEESLFAGESKNIEYKVAVPKKSEKYMKTVVAFANGNGGKIVFGIDDKTLEIVGMDEDNIFKTMDAITNAISDSCEPRIRPDVTLQTVNDKTVIVVEILPGAMRPYYIKSEGMTEGTYMRVSGTTRPVEGYMLKELILEGQNRYFDSEPCRELQITDEDIQNLCKTMKETAIKNTWQNSEKAKIKDITKNTLLSWGILTEVQGEIFPTNAYALLTGQLRMQPVIQCGLFKGKDRAYFADRKEFDGPIQNQVDAAYQYVLEKINMGMQIQGIYRQDVYELPTDSVRELIANAVAHRSYLEPGNIQVAIFDDRLEVTSPGMLLNNVSIKKMMEGYSKPRNPAIANAFAYMKIIEKWGTGIPRIFRECREYGLPDPELIDFDGDFRVNMYRNTAIDYSPRVNDRVNDKVNDRVNDKVNDRVNEIEEKILKFIDNDPAITITQLSMELELSRKTIAAKLKTLKEKKMIERVGSSRKGYWKIL